MKRRVVSSLLAVAILITPASSLAHPGRTDASGGHKDNKNKSGLGSYHYHCGTNDAHKHTNGKCPYGGKAASKPSSTAGKKASHTSSKKHKVASTKSSQVETNKKIQTRLNKLGYNCGKVDGNIGNGTIAAIKKFQKAKGLKVDGKTGPQTMKALGL